MSYSIWDKQPELILPKIPFEFLAGLAEKRDKQLNEVDSKIGELKGKFASLVAAPGHEDLATGLTTDYNNKVNEWYEKYKSNPLSREGSRELSSLASQFANDQKVQTVVKSRQFYEKFEPKMWEEMSKRSYINAPGILNDDGSFNQNTQTYDMSKFQLTSQADWNTPIQKQFALKHAEIAKKHNVTPTINPTTGDVIYTTTEETEREWKDPNTFKDVVNSIEYQIMDSPVTDPGYLYLKETARRAHPGDEKAQRAYVRDRITNAYTPFLYDVKSEKTTIKEADGSGSRNKLPDSAAKLGVDVTRTLDHMVDENGNRITSTKGLEASADGYKTQITVKEGEISKQFAELSNPDGTLNPNAFIHDNEGYKIINTNLIKDPLDKQNAEDYNAQLRFLQNKEASSRYVMTHFSEEAGFTGVVKDANGNLIPATPEQEVAISNPKLAQEAFNTAFYNFTANPTYGKLFPTNTMIPDLSYGKDHPYTPLNQYPVIQNNVYRASDKFSYLLNKKITSAEDIANHAILADKRLVGTQVESLDKQYILNGLSETMDEVYSQDPRYKKYKDSVNNYLATTIATNAYNYSIVKDGDKGRIKDLLPFALRERKIERATFGPDAPQTLEDEQIEEIITNITDATNQDLDNKFSIRLDESKGRFVVDMITSKYGTIEIDGFDQNGLASLVQQQDPNMSHVYLKKQASLVSQLDASNGRYALYDVPLKDNEDNILSNDRIVVKSALDTRGDIRQGDFLFTLPEIPGKVLNAKNSWGLINFLDAYKDLKQAGYTGDTLVSNLLNYQGVNLMDAYNVKSYQERYNNVGASYFPTAKSRTSPLFYNNAGK